jgi:peptide/nickel transport system substrate-binding protein
MKVAVVGTAVIAMFAAGCTQAPENPPAAAKGGELRTNLGEPESLLPTNSGESEGIAVIRSVYEGLVNFDANTGQPVNAIAESIESTDNKLWTIKIKSGYKFDNGEAVTSDSFIKAWNFGAYGPNTQGNSYFFDRIVGYADLQSGADPDGDGPQEAPAPAAKEMSGLKKVDDSTFTVTLTDPFAGWPVVLGYSAFYPLAAACLADAEACNEKPIGNGPFKFDGAWEHKVQIKLVRNDDFAGTKANIDKLTFRIYDNQDTALLDLQAGELDVIDFVPPARLPEVRQQYGERFVEQPTSSLTYVGLPLYEPTLQNKLIRQALSLAVDRQAIIDAAFQGARIPAGSLAPELILGGGRTDACDYCKYDPTKAKALLQQAGGWPAGQKLTFWFNAGAGHDTWVQGVADSIKSVLGIEYELNGSLQFAEYLATGDEKKFTGPFRLGWSADYPLLENYLKPLFGAQGSSNYPNYNNPAFDAKIAQGDNADSVDAAVKAYQEAEDMVMEDMPIIPMWWGKSMVLTGDTVESITINKITDLDFATAVMKQS